MVTHLVWEGDLSVVRETTKTPLMVTTLGRDMTLSMSRTTAKTPVTMTALYREVIMSVSTTKTAVMMSQFLQVGPCVGLHTNNNDTCSDDPPWPEKWSCWCQQQPQDTHEHFSPCAPRSTCWPQDKQQRHLFMMTHLVQGGDHVSDNN